MSGGVPETRNGTTGVQNSAPRDVETWRHHTDNLDGIPVEQHRRADDVRPGSKAAHPGAVVQHCHARRVRDVVAGPQPASEQWPDAQGVEEVRRDPVEPDAGRLAASLQDRAPVVRSHDRGTHEGASAPGPLAKMSIGQLDDSLAAFVGLPHDCEVVGGLERQRPEEHGVHGAEDGAIGADGDGEGQDGGRHIAGRLAQVTCGVAERIEHMESTEHTDPTEITTEERS
jgi:hypothetical protein